MSKQVRVAGADGDRQLVSGGVAGEQMGLGVVRKC